MHESERTARQDQTDILGHISASQGYSDPPDSRSKIEMEDSCCSEQVEAACVVKGTRIGGRQSWVQVLLCWAGNRLLELAFSPVLLALCGHGDMMGTTVLCSLTQAGPRSKVLIMNLLSSIPSQASGDPKALCT